MKKIFLTTLVFLYAGVVAIYGQSLSVNTDGSTAHTSAMLDVKSTLKGMLIPRMSRTEKNTLPSPATGLLIFQDSPDSIGFYYYNGTAWTWMLANSNANLLAWRTLGNSGTVDANHFIGTTDNVPFNIRVNNQRSGRIDHIGWNSFYGYQAANANSTGIHNTAMGYQALLANLSGTNNTAIGALAAISNTTGDQNTATGYGSLYENTVGVYNTAYGFYALFHNVAGSNATSVGGHSMLYANSTTTPHINNNVALGFESLRGNPPAANNTGLNNTALGYRTLFNNGAGSNNTAAGLYALNQNTTGGNNTAVGTRSLFTQSFSNGGSSWSSENVAIGDSSLFANQPTSTTNGYQNTAVGNRSLRTNSIGWQNTALGTFSLYYNTIGQLNTANGWSSLFNNNSGFYNTALGAMAMYYNTTGGYNVGVGTVSLHHNVTGSNNTALGQQAGLGTSGNSFSNNTIIGYQSGYNLTTGSDNVFLGHRAGYNVTSASNKLYIANNITNPPLVYGDFTSGYLGLGTTIPSAKLHVGGGTRFTMLDTGSVFLQSGNTIGSARDWKMSVTLPNGYLSFRDMGFDNLNNGMASDAMTIAWGTGNVGIGATAPSSKLEVNGYTKLGTGGTVPAVQMKKLTGTSPASAGATALIPHGLDWTKILAVDVLLDNGASTIPPRYDNPAVDYSFHVTSADIVIFNGVSMTSFSRPVRILITHEQ